MKLTRTHKPKTGPTGFDRIVIIVVMTCIVLLVGYNIGLSVGAERAIPHDSTPLQDEIGTSPVRFVVTDSDKLESGIIVDVVQDYVWHECMIIITYHGIELASAIIDH